MGIRCTLRSAFLFTAMLAAWTCGSAWCQTDFARRIWRVADGLQEDTVQALTESRDGYLWIGSSGGLARFDGFHVDPAPVPLAREVLQNSIFCLTKDLGGGLWVGTEGAGLLDIKANGVDHYTAANGLSNQFVRAVLVARDGGVWIGTDEGLFRIEGQRAVRMDTMPTLRPLAVHAIVEDGQGTIWVGGSRLVSFQPGSPAREFSLPGSDSNNRVKSILASADGTLWVGTVGGLDRLEDGRFHPFAGIQGTVRSLLQTSDGDLWVGTIGSGLRIVRRGTLLPPESAGLLPSDTVLSMLEDSLHQVWIGTQSGLIRLSRTPVHVIALPQSGDPDYETIGSGVGSDIWVVAQRLFVLHDRMVHAVTLPGLGSTRLRNTLRTRTGDIWIGTDGNGVYRLKNNQLSHMTAPDVLTNNFIRAILETRSGDVWVATDEGVSRITKRGAERFTERNGLVFFSTRCLLEDRRGSVWIGTDGGLSRWTPAGFQQDEVTHRLAGEKIWSMFEDAEGTLWFGTRGHGLFRLRHGVLQHVGIADGLLSDSVYSILEDHAHNFWLTGPNTIYSAPAASMDAETLDATNPGPFQFYEVPFQADGAQFYGGRQATSYLAQDDSVWTPTSKGVLQVSGANRSPNARPRIGITSIMADGHALPVVAGIKLPARMERLSIQLACVSLQAGQRLLLRYKLEGFDSSWVDADADRVATWTNLRAGHYRLLVSVVDLSHPGSSAELDFPFLKTPFFYQTWWFRTLLGMFLAGCVWAVYRLRVRRMQARFQVVLQERSRLAREMHDTVIQGCTGISALLEAVASTAGAGKALDPAQQELLDYARAQASATIDEARHAIWDLHHEHEPAVDLVAALCGMVEQTKREFQIDLLFESMEHCVPLRTSTAHELLMTAREAVYNSVQHSGSARVTLVLACSDGRVNLSVTDDGRGFLQNEALLVREGHYGILGMRERMQRIGGSFQVTSMPEQGTKITLQVDVTSSLQVNASRTNELYERIK